MDYLLSRENTSTNTSNLFGARSISVDDLSVLIVYYHDLSGRDSDLRQRVDVDCTTSVFNTATDGLLSLVARKSLFASRLF